MSAVSSIGTATLGGAFSTVAGKIIALKWPLLLGTTPDEISSMQGALQTIIVAVVLGILYLGRAIMEKYNLKEPEESGDGPPV